MKGLTVFLTVFSLAGMASADSLNLAGTWRFAMDPDDRGMQQAWFGSELPGGHSIVLPGSLQAQGFGDIPGPDTQWVGDIRQHEWNKPKYAPYRTAGNFKMPFWLQPEKYYQGAAWYQRKITIPDEWKNKHIILTLERPHWETRVWVDSNFAGSSNYLSVPHRYDLSRYLTPGEHTLTIRVDNRVIVNIGPNSHSISDHTQSNWNGIVGAITLAAEPLAWIDDLQVYPDLHKKSVDLTLSVANQTGRPVSGTLTLDILQAGESVAKVVKEVKVAAGGDEIKVTVPLGEDIKVWDEFTPTLYTVSAQLKTESLEDHRRVVFGMRDIATKGTRLILNGRPIFLRGTLECCIFPKTGYPPTDIDSWKRIIQVCKSHGLNHIRFHSWCPPKAAFVAADEMGFYYQIECSSWANQGSSLGDGKPVDLWLYKEADAILKTYGNHPSFLLFAFGNEPAGPENGAVYLREWVTNYKQKDSRRLVTGGAGWPQIEPSHFHVTPAPRIQAWGQELRSRINAKDPETVTDYSDYIKRYPNQPVISHEIGQWCVYPDFGDIEKYTGVLKAKNFEIFRDFLKEKNMLDQAHDFLMASGKLQTLCYKEEIESALRTDGFGGFQLLDLHDFPGQGTALVGVLNPFWDSKPYVSPEEYRRFCNAIVPLVRLPKRIFSNSDTLSAQVEISHFGPQDLTSANVQWTLQGCDGRRFREGVFSNVFLAAGGLYPVGKIEVPLRELPAPAAFNLTVAVTGTDACNDWDIWVYPDTLDTAAPAGILVVSDLDSSTVSKLSDGAKVLLALNPAQIKTDVRLGFSSIFWNTAWTNGQAPHTLGILCDPAHPALAKFPTDFYSNWQWSEPVRNAAAMEMDHLPVGLRPIVQVVPDWFEPKRLGLVFEAKVGKGSLLVCSVNFDVDLESKPVIRQLKHSLLEYMNSDAFAPANRVKIESIQSMFRPLSALEQK